MQNRYAYFDGQIVPIERAKISVMTVALSYGTGIFEGLRAYWNERQERLHLFRPRDRLERLRRNAGILLMQLPRPIEQIERAIVDLLEREGSREDVYVRPLLYKSACEIGPRVHDNPCALAIFSAPFAGGISTRKTASRPACPPGGGPPTTASRRAARSAART